jgi:hypothetical protein
MLSTVNKITIHQGKTVHSACRKGVMTEATQKENDKIKPDEAPKTSPATTPKSVKKQKPASEKTTDAKAEDAENKPPKKTVEQPSAKPQIGKPGTASDPQEKRTKKTKTPQKKRKPARKPRTAIADLPPDRQAEIAGRRQAGAAKRRFVYRPEVPEITETIELHSQEVSLAFMRDFDACNEYAVAIDYVAKERLKDRAEFNRYLQDFQEAIDELTEKLRALYARYEELSNGGMTQTRKPKVIDASVQTRRSLQLLNLFKKADDIIRMVQFLNIYGDLREEEAISSVNSVNKALARCVRGLRNVKVRCFKRIVELESLRMKVSSSTTISEIENARKIASIRKGDEKKTKRVTRRKKTSTIDPNAKITEPLLQDVDIEAISAAAATKKRVKRSGAGGAKENQLENPKPAKVAAPEPASETKDDTAPAAQSHAAE